MKHVIKLWLIIALLAVPGSAAIALEDDPRCSTEADWWIAMVVIGDTFGQGLQTSQLGDDSTATMMFLHSYYKLGLLLEEVPECGISTVFSLRAYVWATAELTMFRLLSSGLHLSHAEVATILAILEVRVEETGAEAKTAYNAFKALFAPTPTPTPAKNRPIPT